MNITPWRRRESLLGSNLDIDEIWNRFMTAGNGDIASHLPEVFRNRPFPPVNIAETEGEFRITMDCPGLDEKDFQIETMGNNLIISGERKWEKEKKGKEFRRIESQYGEFERTIALPDNARIDAKKVDASYKNGVLTILVPKTEKTPTAKIPVHAG